MNIMFFLLMFLFSLVLFVVGITSNLNILKAVSGIFLIVLMVGSLVEGIDQTTSVVTIALNNSTITESYTTSSANNDLLNGAMAVLLVFGAWVGYSMVQKRLA